MGEINKVVFGDRTLIDLTADTVTENTLLSGFTAHRRDGVIIEGTVNVPEYLNDLNDVNITNPLNGQVLTYNNMLGQWVNGLGSDLAMIRIKTEAEWNSTPRLVSERNVLYIYTDHDTVDGHYVPAMKYGDGVTYLIDMAFITDNSTTLFTHINNSNIHVTLQEKNFWNNKVRCYVDNVNPELMVFTTD